MLTPKPYISWTQLQLWESSPERYKQVYVYGEKIPINRGMAFGKIMAECLETDSLAGDPVLDLMMAQIPKLEAMELELTADLNMGRGKNPIPLLVRMDTAQKDLSAFKEYKTGQKPWTKKMVDEFGQITFYATAIWAKTGKIPQSIELVHIPTITQPDGKIGATGDIFRHATTRNMAQVLNMIVRIKKAWAGIQEMAAAELL